MDESWDLDNTKILYAIQDEAAREHYLADHRTYIHQVASSFCKRTLSWNQDDELSLAFIAFNDAISVYDHSRNVPFLAFARKVMHNKLIDYLRKESRHRHVSIDKSTSDQSHAQFEGELQVAWSNYNQDMFQQDRAEEIRLYQSRLREFGMEFKDLTSVSPKHRDYRETLMRAAVALSSEPTLIKSLYRKKQLPIKELAILSGIHTKTLERGRKYIIALVVILSESEQFLYLRGYINFPQKGG